MVVRQKKMKGTTGLEDVFAAYGEAAYHTQLMEYALVSIWMLDSVTQGVSLTKQDLLRFQEDWGKKTSGQLLRPLRKSNLIPTEIKDFLEQFRLTRNRVMHSFFLDGATDIETNDGRERAVAELRQMNGLIQKGQELFRDVLNTYLKDFGVDAEAIRRQVLQRDEDAEP